jgi:hypothetical protein
LPAAVRKNGTARKLGEILTAAKEAGHLRAGGDRQSEKSIVERDDNAFTLEEAGISRDLSSRSQKLAARAWVGRDEISDRLSEISSVRPRVAFSWA